MRLLHTITLAVFSSSLSGAWGLNQLLGRTDLTSDVCGEVNDVLQVPNKFLPGKFITIGTIRACLCISTLPSFIATNIFAISASALAGKAVVTASLTDMINKCSGHQTCRYPDHSSPICKTGSPCCFTCKDGYSPYPSGDHPSQCVCNKPYTECNGKCGIFHACPSGYVKRDMNYGGSKKFCPWGHTACGIYGRSVQSWECVDTQNDLESCGGCMVSLHPNLPDPDGEDCTAIPGVADVSCVRGRCAVHRCMPGYDMNASGTSCIYSEDKDPAVLAAQYGLEHTPLTH
ncbi:hypothetical protein BDQ12DRAFT_605982 [Crucibulum laeve]|uniref:Protein CPL1-like domain-containing protein n=1 Tax=Crucibulum laeve TaxID=68775 RepID=A0A5C3M161_9AGAR|nr:hypothetical protein BDQ12DRAFT_605982 [Crucibulum laeve]